MTLGLALLITGAFLYYGWDARGLMFGGFLLLAIEVIAEVLLEIQRQ